MNAASLSARRQTRGRVEPWLTRVSRFLPVAGIFSPILIHLPDEQVRVDGRRISSTSRTSHVQVSTNQDVLLVLAPVLRRAVDQELNFRIEIFCHNTLISAYTSPDGQLDAANALYLRDIQPRPTARDAFLSRFWLLLSRLPFNGGDFRIAAGPAVAYRFSPDSSCIWEEGNVERALYTDALVTEALDQMYFDGVTLGLCVYQDQPFAMLTTVAVFTSPSYNLQQFYHELLL